MTPQIEETNREMNIAWQFVANTGTSLFLTGKAGTGKTTFLRHLRTALPKRMVVLAPTGVAAINAGGQTIHSFFQFSPGPFVPGATVSEGNNCFRMARQKKNLIRTLDLLVIDEISMVRADLLDRIDDTLRRHRDPLRPFGGVQLLLIGDLMQLSPVTKNDEWAMLAQHYDTPYFFSSHALRQLPYVTVELSKIYRQQDDAFIDILAKVRAGALTRNDVDRLNARYLPETNAAERDRIRLTTHNNSANAYNQSCLDRLPSQPFTFNCRVTGDFPEQNYPAEAQLVLKAGAQVMFVKNDPTAAHAYYNGKIGVITRITGESIEVSCSDSDEPVTVTPVTWENNRYTLDPDSKEIKEEIAGSFTQYPLRTAWAITVHKSQGLTFDKVTLDINSSFAHGQTYVALSRCRSLEGIILTAPIAPQALITDPAVNSYIDSEKGRMESNIALLPSLRQSYTLSLLDELYSFADVDRDYQWFLRVVDEHLSSRYPKFLIRVKAVRRPLQEKLIDIAARFRPQYYAAMQQAGYDIADSPLEKRITDSCRYFDKTVHDIFESLLTIDSVINIENKRVAELYNNALSALRQSVTLKYALFRGLSSTPFSTSAYLSIKAKALLDDIDIRPTGKKKKEIRIKSTTKTEKKTEEKKPKVDTVQETLRLYNTGMSPEQIAEQRNLKPWTIYGHLGRLVGQGLIDIDELVPKDHQIIIRKAAAGFTTAYTLKDIREVVPSNISYPEIKITLEQA
ncbi:MAG: AAA family ATPase [Bacteroidales bacterium]|nr:AAA family ATPase [Bacteroidales bacterium]